jgi:phage tail protein X
MNRYRSIPIIKNSQGKSYYRDNKYPEIPLSVNDIYIVASDGDRFDLLAAQYYGDSSLWWIISAANRDLPQNSLYVPLETQIRIPSNPANIISSYNKLNS